MVTHSGEDYGGTATTALGPTGAGKGGFIRTQQKWKLWGRRRAPAETPAVSWGGKVVPTTLEGRHLGEEIPTPFFLDDMHCLNPTCTRKRDSFIVPLTSEVEKPGWSCRKQDGDTQELSREHPHALFHANVTKTLHCFPSWKSEPQLSESHSQRKVELGLRLVFIYFQHSHCTYYAVPHTGEHVPFKSPALPSRTSTHSGSDLGNDGFA